MRKSNIVLILGLTVFMLLFIAPVDVHAFVSEFDNYILEDVFQIDSNYYSRELAVISGEMSELVEEEYDYAISSYFDYYEIINQNVDGFEDSDGETRRAYAIGYRKLFYGDNIIFVVARGTTTGSEIVDDIMKSDTTYFYGQDVNTYVAEFSDKIFDGIDQCIEDSDLENEPIKFLIAGHSLGGAAANLVAAKLNNMAATYNTTKEDIYCYTFGALSPIVDGTEVSEGYENIHNIYNLKDTFAPGELGNVALIKSRLGNGTGRFGHRETFTYNIGYYEDSRDWVLNGSPNHKISMYTEYVRDKRNYVRFNCEHNIVDVRVETQPATFEVGDDFDTSGIDIFAIYDDGKKNEVTILCDIDSSKLDFNNAGSYRANVSYDGFTTVLLVEVLEKDYSSLNIPKKLVYDTPFVNAYGIGDIVLTNLLYDIKSVTSSNKSVINKCEFYEYGNDCIIVFNKNGVGTATVTVTYENDMSRDCKVVVKKKYFVNASKPYVYWNYGERSVKVTTTPKSMVNLTISDKTYKAKANSKGVATIKVNRDYKYKSIYKIVSRLAGDKQVTYGSIGTNAFARVNGDIWNCKNYIPFRLVGVHKGDVLIVKTNNQSIKYTIKGNYPSGGDFIIYMKNNLGNTPYIKYEIRNKYDQKLFSSSVTINW